MHRSWRIWLRHVQWDAYRTDHLFSIWDINFRRQVQKYGVCAWQSAGKTITFLVTLVVSINQHYIVGRLTSTVEYAWANPWWQVNGQNTSNDNGRLLYAETGPQQDTRDQNDKMSDMSGRIIEWGSDVCRYSRQLNNNKNNNDNDNDNSRISVQRYMSRLICQRWYWNDSEMFWTERKDKEIFQRLFGLKFLAASTKPWSARRRS